MGDRPRVAITLGDPRGIGPEIVERVLQDPPAGADYVVVGPYDLIRTLPCERVVAGVRVDENAGADVAPADREAETAGRLTAAQVEKAVALARQGAVDAVVTGPAEKRALHLAGYDYPGHTEWLGELAGHVDVAMMLVARRLRVVLVTTHIPFRRILGELTTERVVQVGRITLGALREWFGVEQPKLALCAINPHGGEGGLFGDEERTVLAPAAETLGARGPYPADTVFVRAIRGEFDAVLTPYHDVGMTAIKVAAFGRGVNITLGLPFVRTAPDHGTAFDIAGKGVADPSSMREAVALAVRLTRRRKAQAAGVGNGGSAVASG